MEINLMGKRERKKYIAPDIFVVEFETEEGFAVSITNELDIDLEGFGEMTNSGGSERGSWGEIEGDGWD